MNRAAYVLMAAAASVGMAYAATLPTPLKLIWNVSASVPVGPTRSSRRISRDHRSGRGDAAAALAAFLIARGYLGEGTPLLKRVMGLPGRLSAASATPHHRRWRTAWRSLPRDRMGRDPAGLAGLPAYRGWRTVPDEPGRW